MKIKGVAGAKHPTLKKGDAIPLSADEKLEAMAREELAKHSPKGYLNVPISASVVGEAKIMEGRKGIDKEEETQYLGTVIVRYRPLKLDGDKAFPIREQKVKIHCCDAKNDIGVPDLRTLDYKEL